jgi:phosphatidylserine/phosphatidylglycerophosphate/cardiolipin synthase-like enzyme
LKIIVQPGDGIERLLKGIRKAKRSVEIVIFRFDLPSIERALIDAVERGVFVHALIAFTNHGGEAYLRKLEKHFLANGITVARTAGDLVRYHGKMMIVDRKELYLLAFNFTHLDIERSRSFGLVTRNAKLVAEAVKLFEADTKRQNYSAGNSKFLVSPVNARTELSRFIKGAKKELLIYDPRISDKSMLRLLEERKNAGVEIRAIGEIRSGEISAVELKTVRLHTRTIVRDRTHVFIGSQSLRQQELDARREIGIISRDGEAVREVIRTFEEDWAASASKKDVVRRAPAKKITKKLVRSISERLPLAPAARKMAKSIAEKSNGKISRKKIRLTVEDVMKDVVEKAAEEAVKVTAEAS